MRFFTVLAALDTGSSFEGMGASREVTFAALAEPALLLGLAAVARKAGSLSLSAMYAGVDAAALERHVGRRLALLGGALLVVLPGRERPHPGRRPEHAPRADDDPRGDGARPRRAGPGLHPLRRRAQAVGARRAAGRPRRARCAAATSGSTARPASAGMLGAGRASSASIESSMARWRLVRVPQLLVGAGVLAALALVLVLR